MITSDKFSLLLLVNRIHKCCECCILQCFIYHCGNQMACGSQSAIYFTDSITGYCIGSERVDVRTKSYLYFIDLFLSYRTDSIDSWTINVFILLIGWICLHGVLD